MKPKSHKRKTSVEILHIGSTKEFFIMLAIFFILYKGLEFYFDSNTKQHLYKYEDVPCQDKIFILEKPMRKDIASTSSMNESYYHITKNVLHNLGEDAVTFQKTNTIYSKGSSFKVSGYYEGYDTGALSHFAGIVPNYLIQSIKSNEYFWVPYFSFDIDTCSIQEKKFEENRFNIYNQDAKQSIKKIKIDI